VGARRVRGSKRRGRSERPEEHLRDLDEEQPQWWEKFRMVPASSSQVEVARIIGSVGHGREFRRNWFPFVQDDRDRALLESFKRRGFDPRESKGSPISLVECCGEYYVEGDGHRRVSVAHRLKLRVIQAEVFKLAPQRSRIERE